MSQSQNSSDDSTLQPTADNGEPSTHVADAFAHRADQFRLMKPEEQESFCASTARRMSGVPWEIKMRKICQFFCVDPDYGMGVAKALGFDLRRFAR